MFSGSIALMVWAVLLVLAAGVFAASDSAIGAASRAQIGRAHV